MNTIMTQQSQANFELMNRLPGELTRLITSFIIPHKAIWSRNLMKDVMCEFDWEVDDVSDDFDNEYANVEMLLSNINYNKTAPQLRYIRLYHQDLFGSFISKFANLRTDELKYKETLRIHKAEWEKQGVGTLIQSIKDKPEYADVLKRAYCSVNSYVNLEIHLEDTIERIQKLMREL